MDEAIFEEAGTSLREFIRLYKEFSGVEYETKQKGIVQLLRNDFNSEDIKELEDYFQILANLMLRRADFFPEEVLDLIQQSKADWVKLREEFDLPALTMESKALLEIQKKCLQALEDRKTGKDFIKHIPKEYQRFFEV